MNLIGSSLTSSVYLCHAISSELGVILVSEIERSRRCRLILICYKLAKVKSYSSVYSMFGLSSTVLKSTTKLSLTAKTVSLLT